MKDGKRSMATIGLIALGLGVALPPLPAPKEHTPAPWPPYLPPRNTPSREEILRAKALGRERKGKG